MKYPNFSEEKKLWRQGFEYVAGLDESGRGPLAGPVVAAAIMVRQTNKLKFLSLFHGLDDSKKLSEKQRKYFYEKLTTHKNIQWGIGVVSEKVIDKINILQATKLAMKRAFSNLARKQLDVGLSARRPTSSVVEFLLIDGNFGLQAKIPEKSIVKGDQKVFSIAAAGIIAKVTRDRIMKKMHKKFPHYNFVQHKGYGTKAHIAKLAQYGPCQIHRKTFFPVYEM